jgi:hypothetical protein
MADDHLAKLSEQQVVGFYRRLASSIQTKVGGDSLAATLLLHWLDGKGKHKIYSAKYVRNLEEVRSYLRGSARPIFLSQKKTPSGMIGGVVPRIQGAIKCEPAKGPYSIHLEGNVETPLSVEAKAAMGMKVDANELDAFFALHGFTLISDVVISSTDTGKRRIYQVNFDSWKCKAADYYHWNKDKHMTVPNPDFGSKMQGAIAPNEKKITVYHSNAIRVEKAGLAQAFNNESEEWEEADQTVIGPSTVAT